MTVLGSMRAIGHVPDGGRRRFALLLGIAAITVVGQAGIARAIAGGATSGLSIESSEEPIFFEHRSSRLTPRDLATLDRVAGYLSDTPQAHLLVMVPEPPGNDSISFVEARLMAVETKLMERGVNPDSIAMRGGGGRGWMFLKVEHPVQVAATPEPDNALPPLDGPRVGEDSTSPLLLLPASADGGKAEAEAVVADATPQASPLPQEGEPPAPAPPLETWVVPLGSSLQQVLDDWALRAGWSVVYQSDRVYPVEAGATFQGDFITVAGALVKAFGAARPAPMAQFFTGNRVIVVSSGEGR